MKTTTTTTKQALIIGLTGGAVFVGSLIGLNHHINNKFENQETQIELLKKDNLDYKITGETICFPKESFMLENIALNGCYRLVKLGNNEQYNTLVKMAGYNFKSDGEIYDIGVTEKRRITDLITSLDLKPFGPRLIKVEQQTIADIANYAKGKKDLVAKLNKEIANKYVTQ